MDASSTITWWEPGGVCFEDQYYQYKNMFTVKEGSMWIVCEGKTYEVLPQQTFVVREHCAFAIRIGAHGCRFEVTSPM